MGYYLCNTYGYMTSYTHPDVVLCSYPTTVLNWTCKSEVKSNWIHVYFIIFLIIKWLLELHMYSSRREWSIQNTAGSIYQKKNKAQTNKKQVVPFAFWATYGRFFSKFISGRYCMCQRIISHIWDGYLRWEFGAVTFNWRIHKWTGNKWYRCVEIYRIDMVKSMSH